MLGRCKFFAFFFRGRRQWAQAAQSTDPEGGPAWGEVGGLLLSAYCSPVEGEKQYLVG